MFVLIVAMRYSDTPIVISEREGMKHSYIKYEKLSNDVKSEINEYHKSLSSNESEPSFDESIAEWFEKKFDEWLIKKYSKNESPSRRKHFRLDVEVPIRI